MNDPDELVRWAEMYGHPEEWAKTAQQLHAENERLRGVLAELADDPDGHGGFAVRVARTALLVELPAPAPLTQPENERLRDQLQGAEAIAETCNKLRVVLGKANDELIEIADETDETTAERIDSVRALLKDAEVPCNAVDSWCEACGRKHVMRGQVEPCMGCGGNRFVFRNPAAGETP